MSCQEWELRLAADESGPEVEAHLAECPACRALAEELAANSEAMLALGEEVMPPVVLPRRAPSPWRWTAAVAAMLVAGFGLWYVLGPVRTPPTTVRVLAPATDPPQVEPPLPAIAQTRIVRPSRRPVQRPSSWRLIGFNETTDEDGNPTTEALMRKVTRDPDVVIYWLIEPKKEELE
jgi:hypothetical protein